ncbi:MAG: hypothetical protein HY791_12210 [Deltaproteobacteria bacterium]|nr:hypothetical protein [Deltaproteobacteria bacterium]
MRSQKLLTATLAMTLGSTAYAAPTDLSFSPTTSSGHDLNHSPFGQSFRAQASQIRGGIYLADETSFTEWLSTVYPTQIAPGSYPYAVAPSVVVEVQLIEGEGLGGAVLDRRNVTLTVPFMGFVEVDYAALGINLAVGSMYTLGLRNLTAPPANGVMGWVVPAVFDFSVVQPVGAYRDGRPILQGSVVIDDTGIGDNAFQVIDLGGSTPPIETCSATDAVITAMGRDFLVVNGGLSLADHVWYAPQSATVFLGGASGFATGERVSYSGVLDPVSGCHATSMGVSPAPAPIVQPPPPACVRPARARHAEGAGRIHRLGNGFFMVGKKKIAFLACTELETALAVGQRIEWEGYQVSGVSYATAVRLD